MRDTQDRRSLFGISVRRARLNWVKMSFQGQVEFVKQYQAWLKGEGPKKNPPRSEPGIYQKLPTLLQSNAAAPSSQTTIVPDCGRPCPPCTHPGL